MLFQNIEQFKEYSTFQKNMSFQTLSDSIKEAEERFLLPLIDTPQYLDLLRIVDPLHEDLPTTFDEAAFIVQKRALVVLLKRARRVVAKAAIYLVYPHINVTAGDMGVQQNKAANDTSTPANQWSYNDSRKGYLDAIATSSELLLSYLQDNKHIYTKWANSKAFSEYNNLFIRNNKELGENLNTKDSIRAFIVFKPFLALAEEKYIAPIVPIETIAALKNAVKSNNLNTIQEAQLLKIQKTIAWYALYEGFPFLNIRFDGSAITVAVIQDGSTKQTLRADKDVLLLQNVAQNNALFYYNQIKEQYKTIAEESTPQTTIFDNHTKPDFWV